MDASAKCDHKFVDSKRCLKCGWQPSIFRSEVLGDVKALSVFLCPWCNVDCHQIESDSGVPGVTHPLPYCDAFLKSEDALDFVTMARKEMQRRMNIN